MPHMDVVTSSPINARGGVRDSAIELARIVAMAAIVVSHVSRYLGDGSSAVVPSLGYLIDFQHASGDPVCWTLVLLTMLGNWGNDVFVIASAWFLCKSDRVKPRKAIELVLSTFAISVVFLAFALLLGVRPSISMVVKCLLPTTFANNWFITCYLLVYIMHPAINLVILRLGRRRHAELSVVFVVLYMFLPMVKQGLFFQNELVFMVTAYVVTAFVRLYLDDGLPDRRRNAFCLAASLLCVVGLVALLEIAGQRVPALANGMLHFDTRGNPFVMLTALCFFNLMRSRPFQSRNVNTLASLMLYVYLIHDNILVRTYLLPRVWLWIRTMFGYGLLFLWLVSFASVLFGASVAFAWIYKKTLFMLVKRFEVPFGRLLTALASKTGAWFCNL